LAGTQAEWHKRHHNVSPGNAPPLDVEPEDMPVCALHCMLRLVAELHELTVTPWSKHLSKPERAALLACFKQFVPGFKDKWLKIGVPVHGQGKGTRKKPSFNGEQCLKYMDKIDEVLKCLHPGSALAGASVAAGLRRDALASARHMWSSWYFVWEAIKDQGDGTKESWDKLATNLEDATLEFLEAKGMGGGKKRGRYCHYLLKHHGIRKRGPMRPWDTTPGEGHHSKSKRRAMRQSSRKHAAVVFSDMTYNSVGLWLDNHPIIGPERAFMRARQAKNSGMGCYLHRHNKGTKAQKLRLKLLMGKWAAEAAEFEIEQGEGEGDAGKSEDEGDADEGEEGDWVA
jgi:hypothetical protein